MVQGRLSYLRLERLNLLITKYLSVVFQLQLIERFIIDYFDQNPISQVMICLLS